MKLTFLLAPLLLMNGLYAFNGNTPHKRVIQSTQSITSALEEMQHASTVSDYPTIKTATFDYAYGLLMVMRMQILWDNVRLINTH